MGGMGQKGNSLRAHGYWFFMFSEATLGAVGLGLLFW